MNAATRAPREFAARYREATCKGMSAAIPGRLEKTKTARCRAAHAHPLLPHEGQVRRLLELLCPLRPCLRSALADERARLPGDEVLPASARRRSTGPCGSDSSRGSEDRQGH